MEPTPDRCGCRFEQSAPAHHRRLVALEHEPMTSLVELIEMAATWGELEFGESEPVIAPADWIQFAQEHAWSDADRVFDALVALSSIALSSVAPARSSLATVTPLPLAARSVEPVFATV
ncbi:hypothetical protein GCM10027062_22660 [Nocardioides hungaricus]